MVSLSSVRFGNLSKGCSKDEAEPLSALDMVFEEFSSPEVPPSTPDFPKSL